LLDTGSRYSLASLSWCKSRKLSVKPLAFGHQNNLWAANGSALKVYGSVSLEIRIKGLIFPQDLLVISDLSDNIILGTDFMSTYNVTLDYMHGTVQIDDLINVPLASKDSRQRVVRTVNSVFIPPLSEAIIPVAVHKRFIGENILLEAPPTHPFDKFATARVIVKPSSINTVCRILNHQTNPIVLRRGECIAIVSDVLRDDELHVVNKNTVNRLSSEMPTANPTNSAFSSTRPPTRAMLDDFLKRTGIQISDKAHTDDRYRVAQLLFEFQDLFKTSVKDIHQCNVKPFDINLRSDKGAYTRQYKLNAADSAEVESQIKDMLAANVIEPATGIETQKFNAPVFLVPKRGTNAKRLVLDYRKLNAIVDPVVLNLPPVTDLVAEVAQTHSKYFSCLDVISFFWQLNISEPSRKATIFTAPSGRKFQFRVAPFGLCNSPAYSSLTLLNVLERLRGRIAYYVDDICIPSGTLDDHILVLRDLFTELRKANLSLNAKKCTFLQDHAVFLSHKITQDGYTLIPKYSTDVIRNWGSPKSPNALCRWINATGWFRRHIPGFAKRTASLRSLLKTDTPFIWSETHEKIFRQINECIINPPVLRPLDTDSPVYIMTDASSQGTAYMIAQKGQDNKLYPVLFGGQALTDPQTRWPPFQLEIFALIQALQTHYSILSGRAIIAITDNASLQHFNSLHLGSPRLRRWHHLMSQFTISLQHLAGKENSLLDAISRQFEDMPPSIKLQFTPQEDETNDYILRVASATPTSANTDNEPDTHSETPNVYRLHWPSNFRDSYDVKSQTPELMTRHQTTPTTADTANAMTPQNHMTDSQSPDLSANYNSALTSSDISIPPTQFMDDTATGLNPNANAFIPITARPRDNTETDTTVYAISTRRQKTTYRSHTRVPPANAANHMTAAEQSQTTDDNTHQSDDENDTVAPPTFTSDSAAATTEPDIPLTLDDYFADDEFKHIVDYIINGNLTGNDQTDRKTLFTSDSFFVMNNKLYRVTEPRSKRKRNVMPVHTRLCIPRRLQFQTVEDYHKLLNHAGHINLLETLRPRLYFQDLSKLCLEIPRTCHRCSLVKRNQETPRQPLCPRQVSTYNSVYHIDHIKLCRPSKPSGYTHIFVAIEQFSSWPEAAFCYGTSAKESALKLLETVISRHSVPEVIICDRATSFINHLIEHLSHLLDIRISFSASKNPASNSKVEREISRIKQGIKFHADSDPDIETVLPAVLMGLRMTRTRSSEATPFYLSRGFHPSLPLLGSGPDDPSSPQTTLTSKDQHFLEQLTKNMKDLHTNVKENIVEYKGQMKQQYDKAYHVKPPTFVEGSKVYLHTPQIKAGSKSVITHKQFSGPYYITNVHNQPTSDGGVSYLLTHCETGKPHPHPVSALRLKPAHSREALIERLYPDKAKPISLRKTSPKTQTTDDTAQATSQAAAKPSDKPTEDLPAGYEPALRIVKQQTNHGKRQFLVMFTDN